ncbi:E3 ubiquitin-protein ligase PPP1R11-like isoform X3 [Gordionus sp. m RMFG-2023]|uniref:E3 ubiquitin-protein ligase PPP1R11-like isoform X3 n=1 Tax=Gordionus sp. m RMFG-2023 TaxID=3053472 RepID=UPI0031FBFF28
MQNISHSSTNTQTIEEQTVVDASPSVKMKLKKPQSKKNVKWDNKTVDNENMGKKKSKCCCIYEKPDTLENDVSPTSGSQISSSESDDDNDSELCHDCHYHDHIAKNGKGFWEKKGGIKKITRLKVLKNGK